MSRKPSRVSNTLARAINLEVSSIKYLYEHRLDQPDNWLSFLTVALDTGLHNPLAYQQFKEKLEDYCLPAFVAIFPMESGGVEPWSSMAVVMAALYAHQNAKYVPILCTLLC